MDLFYSPEYAKAGDVIPFYDGETGRFENYYLKNWNPDTEGKISLWMASITTQITGSMRNPYKYTAELRIVIRVNGLYHMFYCTFDQNHRAQWARHATSTDLTCWEDIPKINSDLMV